MAESNSGCKESCARCFSRRQFLKMALATGWLVGCYSTRAPKLTPFVEPADTSIPGGAVPPAPEQITIRFAHHSTEDYDTLARKFNECYPHINIDPISGSCHDVLSKLRSVKVDVRLVCWWETLYNLQKHRAILPLDTLFDQDESFEPSDLYPAVRRTFSISGHTWAIPYGANPVVLYYNRDLFEQYSVPFPETEWTLESFLSITRAIRDPDPNIFGYISNTGYWDALVFVYRFGGKLFDSVDEPKCTTFDDPLTIEALKWYAELYHKHNVAPTPSQLRGLDSNAFSELQLIERLIWEGKIGLWGEEYFHIGGRIRNSPWPMHWGLSVFPQSTTECEDLGIFGLAISSQTQHPEAAWQWLSFLSRQMFDYMIPVRRSVLNSTQYEDYVGQEIAEVTRKVLMNGVPSYLPQSPHFEGALDIFGEAVMKIKSGVWSAEEALYWAQQQAEVRYGS